MQAVQQEIEGLAIEWVTIERRLTRRRHDDRRRASSVPSTGVSVVAVIRDDTPDPAPGPEFGFAAGDVVVCVGTVEGLDRVRDLIDAEPDART